MSCYFLVCLSFLISPTLSWSHRAHSYQPHPAHHICTIIVTVYIWNDAYDYYQCYYLWLLMQESFIGKLGVSGATLSFASGNVPTYMYQMLKMFETTFLILSILGGQQKVRTKSILKLKYRPPQVHIFLSCVHFPWWRIFPPNSPLFTCKYYSK